MPVVYSVVFAGFLNLLIVPLILRIAHKRHWFDTPDERKIHTSKTPRLGGIGIFWSFLLTISLGSLVFLGSEASWILLIRYWPIILGATLIHFMGLADDFMDLRALLKFLIQIAVAVFVVACGFVFDRIWLPFLAQPLELGAFAYPLTVVWIIGIVNAVNLIDGMDGLCAGISGFAALILGMILISTGQTVPAFISFVLAGSLIGYLFFNFPPASIFMGDSGSTFLGFMLAVIPLLPDSNVDNGTWFWIGVLVLSIPIFDTITAVIRRRKAGMPIMAPDQWHLHHKLLKLGYSVRTILNIIYAVMILIGSVAVTVMVLPIAGFFWLVIMALALLSVFFIALHFWKERYLKTTPTNPASTPPTSSPPANSPAGQDRGPV